MKNYAITFRSAVLLLALLFAQQGAKAFTITRFDQSWCVSTFPTTYVSGTFSIIETTAAEFTKNQSNRTMFIDLPAGFQYNTTGGTYSISGTSANDITALSISAITTSRITIRMSVSNATQIDLNTITVNCQINATTTGSTGNIFRNGGNLKLNRSTSNPTAGQALGNLSANNSMAFTSCTSTHTNTTAVPQAINDVEILQVQVVITGTCNVFNLTQLQFNTTGGNGTGTNSPLTNITNAKVYYTGTNNTFSPTGLFATSSAPNGAFTVNGTQALMTGTNYFWLAYDIPPGAIAANLLDAACSSITIDGGVGAKVPTTQNPVGSRTISGTSLFYSRATGNWSDISNWSLTDGGAACSCTPSTAGNVFINTNHVITMDIPDTVNYLTIKDGAVLQDNGSSLLLVTANLNTQGSGIFTRTSALTVNGNLATNGTGNNTTTSNLTVQGNTTVGSGTTITTNGTGATNITLQGHVNLNGNLSSGSNGATLVFNGASAQTFSGTGTISGTGQVTLSTSAKSFATGSAISITPVTAISGTITVTNNGTVNLSGNLNGSVAGSTWVNAANATLNVAGAVLTTGTLTATASPNTVDYNYSGNQTIKATTYNLLRLSGSGTKTFAGNTTINNELNISGALTAVGGTNTISGGGTLIMTGTAELTIAKTGVTVPELTGVYNLTGGTINFNTSAAATQTLRGVTYYNITLSGTNAASQFDLTSVTDISGNLTVQNSSTLINNAILTVSGNFTYTSSGSLTLANDITVTGATTLTAGTLNLNAKYFTTAGLTFVVGSTLNATSSSIEITDAGNWTNYGGAFTNTGSTVLFTGTAAQTIGGTTNTQFNNLTLNNTSVAIPQLILGGNTQVNSTLTFTAGSVNMGGYTMTLGSSAASIGTLSLASGWTYNGTFKRWYNTSTVANSSVTGLLPLGTSSDARHSYITAPATGPSTGGTISVSHTPSTGMSTVSFSDGATPIERRYDAFWTISTGDGLTGGTWNLMTSGTGLNILSSILPLRLVNASGITATSAANAGTASNPQVNRSGFTLAQLSNNFYWGFPQTALPVELISFGAKASGQKINLKWSTASEINSNYFTLYRASADQQYKKLGTVSAAGTTSIVSDYSFTDVTPLNGVNYYRLTETDIDGKEFQQATTTASLDNKNQASILTNPVANDLNLQLTSGNMLKVTVRIYDSTGRRIMEEIREPSGSDSFLRINCSDLPSGFYIVALEDGDQTFQGRFLKE